MTEHLKLNSFPELKLESFYDKRINLSSIINRTQYIKLFIISASKYLV